MKTFKILALFAMMILISGTSSFAQTKLDATGDTFTFAYASTTNYNNYGYTLDKELYTGNFTASGKQYDSRSYLQFTLPTGVSNSSITSAYLYLYNGATTANKPGTSSTWDAAPITVYSTSDFTPTTVKWSTQPALGTAGSTVTVTETLGWFAFDVTNLVKSDANSLISLALTSSGVGHKFYASETATDFAPYLQISSTVVPEPISSVLFLMGAGVMTVFRKFKTIKL